MATLETYLDRKDLTKWDKSVADLMLHLVNDLGVRYRAQDANHIFLYGPNGATRPFKVSASRPGPVQLKYLNDFAGTECAEAEKEWQAKEADRRKAPKVPVAPRRVVTATPKEGLLTSGEPELRELTKGRAAYVKKGRGGGVIKHVETDGTTLWCRVVGCEWTGDHIVGAVSHYRMNHIHGLGGGNPMRKGDTAAVRAERREKRRAEQREAVLVLAKSVGLTLDGGDSKKVERLEAQLAKVTAERDEAVGKVKALKEALK